MFYFVTAQLRVETAADLRRALRDDTIRTQQPDGREIVDAMARAVVTADGTVEWIELCYCETPLAHERQTVLDRYFDRISVRPVDGYQPHTGRRLAEYLDELAAG